VRRRNITIGNDELTAGQNRTYMVGDAGVFIAYALNNTVPTYITNTVRDMNFQVCNSAFDE
jgi:hypothetical protein